MKLKYAPVLIVPTCPEGQPLRGKNQAGLTHTAKPTGEELPSRFTDATAPCLLQQATTDMRGRNLPATEMACRRCGWVIELTRSFIPLETVTVRERRRA